MVLDTAALRTRCLIYYAVCACRSAADAHGAQAEAAAAAQAEVEQLTAALAASEERLAASEQRVSEAQAAATQLRGQVDQYAAGWGDLQSQVEQLQSQNQQLQASLQVLPPAVTARRASAMCTRIWTTVNADPAAAAVPHASPTNAINVLLFSCVLVMWRQRFVAVSTRLMEKVGSDVGVTMQQELASASQPRSAAGGDASARLREMHQQLTEQARHWR